MRIAAAWLLPTALIIGAVIPLGSTDILGWAAIIVAVVAALAIHDVMRSLSDRSRP